MKRALSALALAAVVPFLAACGDDAGGGSGDGGEASDVEVADAGGGDKARFEIDVEEGHRESVELVLAQTIDTGTPVEAPDITFVIDTEVTSVSDDEVVIEQTYASLEVGGDEAVAAQVEETLQPLVGLTGTLTLTPTGSLVESDLEAPADLDPTIASVFEQIEDQAGQISVVFPDEEIGEGAEWSTVADLDLNGVSIEQTTSYTLESLDGDDYTISAEVEQAYEPGETDQFELLEGSGSTTGSFSGTIGRLFASEATSTGSNELRVSVEGQEATVRTQVETTVTGTVE